MQLAKNKNELTACTILKFSKTTVKYQMLSQLVSKGGKSQKVQATG